MLSLHMQSDVPQSSESPPTDLTWVQTLSCMWITVVLQTLGLRKLSAAVVTLEWFLARMCPHVDAQPRRSSEILPTDDARVVLLAGMQCPAMPPQVSQSAELFTAFFADEGSFAGMPGHVVLEWTHPGKALLAHLAGISRLRIMSPEVDVQSAGLAESLLADWTREWAVVGVHSHVNLSVMNTSTSQTINQSCFLTWPKQRNSYHRGEEQLKGKTGVGTTE